MKKGVARKLGKSEIEFQKRCFKRRAKSKVTIRGNKASPRLYWDRGGAAIEKRGRKEDKSEVERGKGTTWRSDRTWQNEWDSEDDRNKMALTT
ncbi:hypothetical protein TNCV_2673371 [Trichonephila clavipes]|nr:hypothetical protein TNCV_2673371 [Trichonephila clavipes]